MHSLEYIDGYFKGEFSPVQKMEFEKKLAEDPQFADDVAFYISTRQVSRDLVKEEKKQKFKKIYDDYNKEAKVVPMRRVWTYAAAAAVVVLVFFGWFMFTETETPHQMADQYIKSKFQTLGVNMGGKQDSVQTALRLFNQNKLSESLAIFEALTLRDSSDAESLKNAGIILLKQEQYDQAIGYFTRLEKLNLYANPGLFLHAISLMMRGAPGDNATAKLLLEEVVSKNLDKKDAAAKFLKSM